MARAKIVVYEIEHGGDRDAAVAALAKAGCSNIVVMAENYDEEVIAVVCDLPPDCASVAELERKNPDLIIS